MKKYYTFILCMMLLSLVCFYGVKKTETETLDAQERTFFKEHSLGEALGKIPQITIFADLIKKSGLLPKLETMKDFTLFAPLDSAFEEFKKNVGPDAYNFVLDNPTYITKIVSMHIIPQLRLASLTALPQKALRNLGGDALVIEQKDMVLFIRTAQAIDEETEEGALTVSKQTQTTDIKSIEIKNGDIHIIDKIIGITVI